MNCPNCNKEIENAVTVCDCGYTVAGIRKKKSKTPLLIGIFAVLALVIAASLFLGGNAESEHDYVIGENEDALYLIDAANPKQEPVMIAEITGEGGYAAEFYIDSEKTKILYANNIKTDEESFESTYDLWVYEIASGETALIDEGIYMHSVNSAFDTVTYFKGKEGELWQKKADGKPEKLYDELMDAWVSDDLQTVYYTDMNKDMYAKHADSEAELIGKEVSVIDYGESALLYVEGEKLIKYENGEKKIISEKYCESANMSILDYLISCEGGYFLTKKQNIDVDSCFVDDMEESDKNIKVSDVEAYAEKLVRDALRLELAASKEWSLMLCDLYYYDGNEATLVCENVIEVLGDASYYSSEGDESVALYKVLGEYELPKLVMSEFYKTFEEEYSSLSQVFYDALSNQSSIGFAKAGKHLGVTEIDNAMNYVYDKKNSTAYVLTETLGDGGEFDYIESYYTVKLGEDSVSEPEIFAEDISSEISEVVGGNLIYCKYDEQDEYMDIYDGKELIAQRVAATEWLEEGILFVGIEGEKEDVPGKLYVDGAFTEADGIENYDMKLVTTGKNIIAYNFESDENPAVVEDGKLVPIAGDTEFIDVFLPVVDGHYYELTSPLYLDDMFAGW